MKNAALEAVTADIVIIGGGPAGLSAALYAARAGVSTVVLDKNPLAGALGRAEHIENYPGAAASLSGRELLLQMRRQAEAFGARIARQQVMGVRFGAPAHQVFTAAATYTAAAVIVATGASARGAAVPGENEFLGRGVSYCATCDAPFFKDKDVAVVGAESAVEELDEISRFCRRVYFICPKKTLAVEAEQHARQFAPVRILFETRVIEITGDTVVRALRLREAAGAEQVLEVSGAFMYLHGNVPVVDYLGEALTGGDNGCIIVDRDMATPLAGVFAAGDVTCKRFRQAIIAASEGCVAALAALKYVTAGKTADWQWG